MSRIEDYIVDENGKEDLFEFDEGYWSVPCGMCENRHMQTQPNKPRLLDQVRNAMRLQRMSKSTIDTYCGWIVQFIKHHKLRHPAEMGVIEIGQFLRP